MRCLFACAGALAVLAAFPATGAAKGIAHVEVIYGDHFRHNDRDIVFISHNGFFPPAYCRKKVKFWLYDGEGRKFYLGKKKAYAKPRYFVKSLPDGAKSGRGKVKGKQSCGRIRGTASDSDRIVIAASGPAPSVKSDRIVGGESGEVVTDQVDIAMTKWDYHFLTVRIEYEVFPDVWQQVKVLGRDQLVQKPGAYEVRWRANVGGKPASAGRYRFVFEFFRREFESAQGVAPRSSDTTEFQLHEAVGEDDLSGATDGRVNPAGELVVADTHNNRLAIFDETGRLKRTNGGAGDVLDGPKDVAFDAIGYQYVADSDNKRVTKLTATGGLVATFGEAYYEFGGPVGIDVTAANGGRVYVVDRRGEPCVRIYDLDGKHVADVSHDPCNSPGDVAAAADGSMWVADDGANELFHFDSNGALLGTAARSTAGGIVPLSIGYQTSVGVAPDGRLYLGARLSSPPSIEFGAIVVFRADGAYERHFGSDEIGYIHGVVPAGLAGDVYIMRRQDTTLRYRLAP